MELMNAMGTMRERVTALQKQMATMEQAQLHTEHFRIDGVYCRMVKRSAGVLIVGKVHRKEHLYVVMSGRLMVTTDDGVTEVCAPHVVVSKPGTKRAVLALEDSVCMTIHRTDNVDLDDIEAELVEPDETALFDSSNVRKLK